MPGAIPGPIIMYAVIKLLFRCQHCGACCNISRSILSEEVERIAKSTERTFCEVDTKLNSYPCGFYENGLCSIHYIKPECCRQYPNQMAYDVCPAYKELCDKIYVPGAMHQVCNSEKLAELYKRVLLNDDYEAAYQLLDKLNIKL